MKTNVQGFRKFLGPVLTLLLLGATVMATPGAPTLAGPPEPTIPQPEPFYFRLEQPLSGPGAAVAPLSTPIHIAANPGEWYNLMAEKFEDSTFPPNGWQLTGDSGWQRWSGASDPKMDTASAGITNTATLTNSWLVYGPTDSLAVSDVANAKLEFSYWLDSEKDAGWFGWAASSDGQSFYGARVSGAVGQWLTGSLDMAQYVGDDSVWLAFFFLGGGAGNGVYVDNVTLQGMEPYKVYLPASLKNYATTFTFTDDFSNTGSGWPHILEWGSTKEERGYITGYIDKFIADYPNDYSIVGGTCREHPHTYFMRNGEWAQRIIAKPGLAIGSQFVMEVDITYCDDALFASTGLVFGLNSDNSQYYRVMLIYDPGGGGTMKYAIWRDSTVLVSTSPSSHLNGGFNTNRVKVVRDGCNISVYFNDHLEWSTSGECYYTGDDREIGLFHDRYPNHGNTGAVLDNFRLEGATQTAGSSQQVVVWTTESWPLEQSLPGVQYIEWHGSDKVK